MKKRLIGTVVSDRMDKTRVVEVTRAVQHPLYKKRYRVTKRFMAHDKGNKTKVGETVTIEESRPLSRLKRWIIVEASASSAEGEERANPVEQALPGERGKGQRRFPSREET